MVYESPLTVEEVARLAKLRGMLRSGEAERIRKRAGIMRSEAAGACGVRESTVWRWETGRKPPLTRRALAYLRLLELLTEAIAEKRSSTSGPGWPD